jgi:hypothetical protein
MPQMRLEIFAKGSHVRTKAYTNNEMVRRSALPYPLKITPITRLNYFVEREKFDPMSYLKNPMVLIIGLSMVMMFVMPKMVDNLDDNDKAQLRDTYSKTSTITQGK